MLGSFCWLFLGDHLQLVKPETKGDPLLGARRLRVLPLGSVVALPVSSLCRGEDLADAALTSQLLIPSW